MPSRGATTTASWSTVRLVDGVDHRLQLRFVVEQAGEPLPPLRQVGRDPEQGVAEQMSSSRLSAGARGSTVDDVVEPALGDGRDTFGLAGEVVGERAPGDPDRVGDVGDRHGRVAARHGQVQGGLGERSPGGVLLPLPQTDSPGPDRRRSPGPMGAALPTAPVATLMPDCRPQFAHCAIFPRWQRSGAVTSDTSDRRAAARRIPLPRAYSDSGFRPGAPSVRVRGGSDDEVQPQRPAGHLPGAGPARRRWRRRHVGRRRCGRMPGGKGGLAVGGGGLGAADRRRDRFCSTRSAAAASTSSSTAGLLAGATGNATVDNGQLGSAVPDRRRRRTATRTAPLSRSSTPCRATGPTPSPRSGTTYREADTVFFSGSDRAPAAAQGSSGMGPFYCPPDQQVYIDLSFWDELRTNFGANDAPFTQAYVLAHEYGHHVQNLLGTSDRVGTATGATSGSVRLELQADCYAGVWANHATTVPDASGQVLITEITNADLQNAIADRRRDRRRLHPDQPRRAAGRPVAVQPRHVGAAAEVVPAPATSPETRRPATPSTPTTWADPSLPSRSRQRRDLASGAPSPTGPPRRSRADLRAAAPDSTIATQTRTMPTSSASVGSCASNTAPMTAAVTGSSASRIANRAARDPAQHHLLDRVRDHRAEHRDRRTTASASRQSVTHRCRSAPTRQRQNRRAHRPSSRRPAR